MISMFLYLTAEIPTRIPQVRPEINGLLRGVMGGLLTLNSFIDTFPQLDTSSKTYNSLPKSAQVHQATIQGTVQSHASLNLSGPETPRNT